MKKRFLIKTFFFHNDTKLWSLIPFFHDLDPRIDDQMDAIENELLEKRHERIEYRWLAIERARSLAYWYPFYPRVTSGETADDCCDQDRLISFEDDLAPFLVDLTLNSNDDESLKFKLLLSFFHHIGLIVLDDTSHDLTTRAGQLASTYRLANDDFTFLRFVYQQSCSFLENSIREEIAFLDVNSVLETLIRNLFDPTADEKLHRVYTMTALNFVTFVRNSIGQAYESIREFKLKTYLTVLKWKFELELYESVSRHGGRTGVPQPPVQFEPVQLKANLLNQAKIDLSLEVNRSNFDLWKEYAILKLIINKGKFFEIFKLNG